MVKNPIVSIKNISKSFGKTKIIENLNLDICSGKFTCILGSSGSGKTTILRLISGLEKPDSGKILINGELVSEGPKMLLPLSQRGIGYIFQELALWSHFTVFDNIAFGLKVKHPGTSSHASAYSQSKPQYFTITHPINWLSIMKLN